MIGRTLSHYKILQKLGSGGMGDVSLAQDTEPDRDVALKVLPPELAESEERRARFKREAKAVAALNHPHIVTVHFVEEADGVHFITMELVRGKTLSEVIPRKGLSLAKFFEIAIPLADAVAAAHEKGVLHRDLNPRQSDAERRRKAQDPRLRPREAEARGRGQRHQRAPHEISNRGRADRGNGRLHVPGAGGGEDPRFALRHLLPRNRALRDGDRGASLSGRNHRFGALVDPQGHAPIGDRHQPRASQYPGKDHPAMSGQRPGASVSDGEGSPERVARIEAGSGLGGGAGG